MLGSVLARGLPVGSGSWAIRAGAPDSEKVLKKSEPLRLPTHRPSPGRSARRAVRQHRLSALHSRGLSLLAWWAGLQKLVSSWDGRTAAVWCQRSDTAVLAGLTLLLLRSEIPGAWCVCL